MLLGALALTACQEEAPDPETIAPPPPTAGELANEIRQGYSSQIQAVTNRGHLTPQMMNEARNGLLQKTNAVRGEENGPQAIQVVTWELADEASEAYVRKKWGLCLLAGSLFQSLERNDTRLNRIMERSDLEIRRPIITNLSFMTVDGDTTVFVRGRMFDGSTFNERVSVGDNFLGLRLERIVGRQKGVRVQYLATGQIYDVMN